MIKGYVNSECPYSLSLFNKLSEYDSVLTLPCASYNKHHLCVLY